MWNASKALDVAQQETASAGEIRITATELERVQTGIEPISSPSRFYDAAVYRGQVYAAGPAGLFTDNAEYRVGDLLPPAPLTSMAEAITSQSVEPELWIGTAGEGMLSFDGVRFRHVRPADGRFRDVTSVLGLKVGRVLFGTKKAGVLAFDGKALAVLHESVGGMHVTALAGDETDLWIGTIDRGLLHWRAGQVTFVEGLPDRHVLSIARDGDVIYAGTRLGSR
jgi:ligand-binding sensor domain-containing protein